MPDTPVADAPEVNVGVPGDPSGLSGVSGGLDEDTLNNVAEMAQHVGQPQGGLSNLAPPAGAPTPAHKTIAEGIMSAFSKSDGSAGGFLRSVLAGGLAGASAAASAPQQPGGGVAHGLAIGAGAGVQSVEQEQAQRRQQQQQQTDNAQRQQQIDLAKQREEREKTTGDRDYDLRMREDARQQAASIRDASMFEKRGTLMDQEIENGKFDSVKKQADYLQQQSDAWNDLTAHGGQRLKVNGAESPEFDHLGDAEDFAMQNQDAVIHEQFKTRLMRNPDTGKWAIMETPYEAPKWHEITDASGQPQRIFTDTQGALAAQKEVAETKHYLNVAAKSSADLKKDLEEYKEEGTVKGARKELDKVGGDISKLSPSSKSALEKDATEQFTKVNTLLERIEGKDEELRTPEEKETLERYKPVRDYYAKQIAEFTRPSWVPKPGSPEAAAAEKKNATPAPNPAPQVQAPPRPQNVPSNYVYKDTGNSATTGWYKPQAPAAAPNEGVAPPM